MSTASHLQPCDCRGHPPDRQPITIALAKGALLADAIRCLQQVGIDFSRFLDPANRLLRIESPTQLEGQRYAALLVRNQDVPVYVEYGQAQLGIVGYDVLRERYAGREAG
jgi:ATP phosphoribosyltransferase